ncbi:hypothetical protein IQ07DRAFT_352281 [Pyrenochaeta sp. DS3sAY3a]|nr:hypothetical protein IQ07DRAFT_352281 [Pyrenochaeta sp. DS3sAY3a]
MPLLSQLRLEFMDRDTESEKSLGGTKSQYSNGIDGTISDKSTGEKVRWRKDVHQCHDADQLMVSSKNHYVQAAPLFAKGRVLSTYEATVYGKFCSGLNLVDTSSMLRDAGEDAVGDSAEHDTVEDNAEDDAAGDDDVMIDNLPDDSPWSSLLIQEPSIFAPDRELNAAPKTRLHLCRVQKDSSIGETCLHKILGFLGLGKKPQLNSRGNNANHDPGTANSESLFLQSEIVQANASLHRSIPSRTNRLTHAQVIPGVLFPGATSSFIDTHPMKILPAPLHEYTGFARVEMDAYTPQHVQRDFDAINDTQHTSLAKRTNYTGSSIFDREGDAWVKWQMKNPRGP